MLDKTPKTFNARFEKEVHFAIADLIAAKYGRDKTEAVGRAILEARERLSDGLMPMADRSLVQPVPLAAPVVADAPFHPLCKHCGENFGAWNRNAALCPDCKSGRHAGDPRECPICTSAGTGAL